MPFPQVSPKHDLRKLRNYLTHARGQTAMVSAMFLKDGTTLRSSAIRELSFEKHADTPERAEAPSRSLELRVTNPRRKDDCGGQPAIEAQTLLPRDLILALQGALRPSAAHVLRLRRVQLLAGSWGNVACGWKWRASWQRATAVPE